jgi:hypothetical protein
MTQPNAETDSGNVPSMPSVALFRTLDQSEVASFRAWARANYTPLSDIKGIWHPIIQDECRQMNQEHGRSVRLSPFYAHSAMRNTEPARKISYGEACADLAADIQSRIYRGELEATDADGVTTMRDLQ